MREQTVAQRSAPLGSGKQVILAAKRDGTNRALDGVGIEFDASVIKEAAKSVPAVQRITSRISKAASGWDVGKLGFQPKLHGSDQRQRAALTHALPNGGGLATDGSLD